MFLPVWVFGLVVCLMLAIGLALLFAFARGNQRARMFRAVAEGASDGLVLMERDSRIVWVNRAYCKIMGYPRDELVGRYPLRFALPPEDALSEEEIDSFRFDPKEERFGKLTQVMNARGVGAEELLNRADVALYNAKDKKGLYVSGYDAATHAAYVEQQGMQHEVCQAIAARDFQFHLQPVVDLRNRCISRFKMLARWTHPRLGLLGPGQFLPLVEQLGLIEDLDRHVVESGLELVQRLGSVGLVDTGLSINLSASALRNATIPEFLIWQSDRMGIDPGRLSVEILETTAVALTHSDAVATEMRRLADAGFRLLLDDFGMGYAGLAHLAMTSVHGVKIDRQLTCLAETDRSTLHVIAAIVELAAQLNVEVIVEGVETEGQIEAVREVGGDIFQGYAVARPMPFDEAVCWARQVWPEWSTRLTDTNARRHG